MKLVEVAFVLLVFAGAGYGTVMLLHRVWMWIARRRRTTPWHVTSKLHGHNKVYLLTNGIETEEFARVPRNHRDYDAVCLETRAAAEEELAERRLDEIS